MIVSAPAFYDPMTSLDMMPIPDVVIDPVPAPELPPFYDPVTSLPPVPIPTVPGSRGVSTGLLVAGALALAFVGLSK